MAMLVLFLLASFTSVFGIQCPGTLFSQWNNDFATQTDSPVSETADILYSAFSSGILSTSFAEAGNSEISIARTCASPGVNCPKPSFNGFPNEPSLDSFFELKLTVLPEKKLSASCIQVRYRIPDFSEGKELKVHIDYSANPDFSPRQRVSINTGYQLTGPSNVNQQMPFSVIPDLLPGDHYFRLYVQISTDAQLVDNVYLQSSSNANVDFISIYGTESSIVGDPHISGLDGSYFDFNGIAGNVYSIISSPGFQLNSQFLESESFTYLGPIGVRVNNDTLEYLPNDELYFNGQLVKPATEWATFETTWGKYHKVDKHFLVETDVWAIKCGIVHDAALGFSFVNLWSVSYKPAIDIGAHGLLGHTIRPRPKTAGCEQYSDGGCNIEGIASDYIVRDGLLGTQFKFSRFNSSAMKGITRKALGVSETGGVISNRKHDHF